MIEATVDDKAAYFLEKNMISVRAKNRILVEKFPPWLAPDEIIDSFTKDCDLRGKMGASIKINIRKYIVTVKKI